MKLLKIQAKGFKSFADSTSISFPEKVTCVVGPNGCGKSNIADAIKWVFGEQSAKNLRGKKMDDVIFAGSQSRKATNFAEVSLLFDNSDRKVKLDFNQIEITRRLYRGDGANHYFINKEPVRLKDIQEITMDSSLGKGTLGLISQGTVSSFAEAKAEDRRVIFDEAANVSKYKKRKLESIRKLERSRSNLERVSDIIFELEKQYKPLKKQVKKARKYIELKSILQDKEVTLMVHDILVSTKILENKSAEIASKKEELEKLTNNATLKSSLAQNKKDLIHDIDLKINKLQSNLIDLSSKADSSLKLESIIAYQKNELVKSENKAERILQLKILLPNLAAEKSINQNKLQEISQEIKNTKTQIYEFEKSINEISMIVDEINIAFTKLNVQKQLTENNIKKNSSLPYGVAAVLEAKSTFPGMIGVALELVQPHKGYELALSAAMGRQKDSIIVKTKEDSKQIIQFLKANRSGRATILPLDSVKEKSIAPEAMIAASQVDGFISKMSDAVKFDIKISSAVKFILGNILIAEDINSAYELSALTQKKFRVVTLDGQVVNVGGSVTGGHAQPVKSKENLNKLLEIITTKIAESKIKKQDLDSKKYLLTSQLEKAKEELNILKSKEIKMQELVEAQWSRIVLMTSEYKELTGDNFVFESSAAQNTLVEYSQQVNEVKFVREEIKTLSEKKSILLKEWKILDDQAKDAGHELQGINNLIHNNEVVISREEVKLENFTNRLLSEYKLTFDFAKEKFNDFSDLDKNRLIVNETRAEIDKLGYVNIEAIEQFIEIEKRYLNIKEQYKELTQAKKSMVDVIDEMDEKIIKDFDETFNKINNEFQNTFSRLFGGGFASLEYSDPENILESGIEVKVKPPGKSITNLNLFSSGEKSMITLSVLFAILKINPIPLVVLDEVEAPLDQVNVERFSEYLKDFADNTQFIVITHRSGTMQKCDNIYGITMQEQGISKVISINLADAEKLAEANN